MGTLIRFRLRVFGFYSLGIDQFVWSYEVVDLQRPKGSQIIVSGSRTSWAKALSDGMAYMRGQYD